MKYYFKYPDSENCYTKQHFIQEMKDRGITELEVYPAKIMYGLGYFYCQEFGESGESGEGCGKDCESYKPRNGKNGRCVHHSCCYEASDIIVILRIKRSPGSTSRRTS